MSIIGGEMMKTGFRGLFIDAMEGTYTLFRDILVSIVATNNATCCS